MTNPNPNPNLGYFLVRSTLLDPLYVTARFCMKTQTHTFSYINGPARFSKKIKQIDFEAIKKIFREKYEDPYTEDVKVVEMPTTTNGDQIIVEIINAGPAEMVF